MRRAWIALVLAGAALIGMQAASARTTSGFALVDATAAARLKFTHFTGAFGRKYLPETLGSGVAIFDVDNDGRQDVLLLSGTSWPDQRRPEGATSRLFRNLPGGVFEDITAKSGLGLPIYGMGAAAADYDNDGHQDVLITAIGQSRLFRNSGGGQFIDVTERAGLGGHLGFSTSALWFDYDRDGDLDLVICNYVRWTPETDVYCSADGKEKSYCTPEAYPGATSWLFRNRGNGTFEDVTAAAGLFDPTSKALGVTMLDYDVDGWQDLFVANDTQPNKLYRNQRNGTFTETAVQAGLAFSEDGRARAGMGTDAADFDNSGVPSIVVTNFSGEMLGLYTPIRSGVYADRAPATDIGRVSRQTLGFGCFFFDVDLDGLLDLLVVNGHIDDSISKTQARVSYAEPPHLFHNRGGKFVDVSSTVGSGFAEPKVGRGAAFGDFDLDGDLDIVLTTNGGQPRLYRTDLSTPNRSVRVALRGAQSNRDGIGASVRVRIGSTWLTRSVRTGSSYLSQSELPLTFGLGSRDAADEAVIEWPSGAKQNIGALRAGRSYLVTEGKGAVADRGFAR
ncbi:MAG TPA: CRTAC1 family protein [Vicinamibacterales bacterium]|nr:CRTAC1 family protein [Vicinamibacterales bacterium]